MHCHCLRISACCTETYTECNFKNLYFPPPSIDLTPTAVLIKYKVDDWGKIRDKNKEVTPEFWSFTHKNKKRKDDDVDLKLIHDQAFCFVFVRKGKFAVERGCTELSGLPPRTTKTRQSRKHTDTHTSSCSVCFTTHTHTACECTESSPPLCCKGGRLIQQVTHLLFSTDSSVSLPDFAAERWRK